MRAFVFSLALLILTGCGHYEYDLVQPAQFAGHIGAKVDYVVPVDSLEFRMRAYDDHLVMRIYNHTDQPINLVGPASSVIDPTGQSHPIPSQPIPPDSFIKLILPPEPDLVQTPPGWHFGFGAGFWRHSYDIDGYYEDGSYAPGYYTAYGPDYWPWPNHTPVRLVLTFDRPDKPTAIRTFLFHQDRR